MPRSSWQPGSRRRSPLLERARRCAGGGAPHDHTPARGGGGRRPGVPLPGWEGGFTAQRRAGRAVRGAPPCPANPRGPGHASSTVQGSLHTTPYAARHAARNGTRERERERGRGGVLHSLVDTVDSVAVAWARWLYKDCATPRQPPTVASKGGFGVTRVRWRVGSFRQKRPLRSLGDAGRRPGRTRAGSAHSECATPPGRP